MPRKNDDDKPKFRLRPRKPPIPREPRSSPALSVAFRAVMKYARSSRAGRSQPPGRVRPPHFQHCSLRVTYSPNRVTGHWRAHGIYIARESASLQSQTAGFSAETTGVGISSSLLEWQTGGDPRRWKLIISPEFGDRIDLQRLTRDVMGRVEADRLSNGWRWRTSTRSIPTSTSHSGGAMPKARSSVWIEIMSRAVSAPWPSISRPCNSAIAQSRTPLSH